MGLNDTASGQRPHIGFFGVRNAGKSSLVNAVTGQQLAVVSAQKGTTTDPVRKAMELLPLGPVVIIDTPGLDDEGELGAERVRRAKRELAHTDIAVLVVDGTVGMGPAERQLEQLFCEKGLPYVIAYNKADMVDDRPPLPEKGLWVSAATGEGVTALKQRLGSFAGVAAARPIAADLLAEGETAVLVIPVDDAAPKGRLILPQQQTMRDMLDAHHSFTVCQPQELAAVLAGMQRPPKLVITDSQAFGAVAKTVPPDVWLTSFSILFARYKGDLATLVRGAAVLSTLRDGDRVLISEGCTHHRQCGDIGTVKLPGWIEGFCGAKPAYTFTSGGEFPEDVADYRLIVHCGGCMLNAKEMAWRIGVAEAAGVPIVNYGVAIAHMHGILARSLQPFPAVAALLQGAQGG